MCAFACMHVHIYTAARLYTNLFARIIIDVWASTHAHTCMLFTSHECLHTCVCMHVYINAFFMHVHMYAGMNECKYVCNHACMHIMIVCRHVLCLHMYALHHACIYGCMHSYLHQWLHNLRYADEERTCMMHDNTLNMMCFARCGLNQWIACGGCPRVVYACGRFKVCWGNGNSHICSLDWQGFQLPHIGLHCSCVVDDGGACIIHTSIFV